MTSDSREKEIWAGRFQIVRLIGAGGMGEVYEAFDLELRGPVALKTIRQDLASRPESLARFKREILLARRVTHTNVCRIHDLFHHTFSDGRETAFLTMELVEAQTLADFLKSSGKLPPAEAFPIIAQLASGLAAAHREGVVHRDLKPSNILLDRSSRPFPRAVITDFGLAQAGLASEAATALTQTGQLLGTLEYMAPEQVRGQETSPQTDIYAFGLVIFEMVTGLRPFPTGSPLASALRRMEAGPPSVKDLVPDLDPIWDRVVNRCLEVEPGERYSSVTEIVDDLAGVGIVPSGVRGTTTAEPAAPGPSAKPVGAGSRPRAMRWKAALAALLVALAAWSGWLILRPAGDDSSGSPAVVGIVPFENRTGKEDLDWYGEGIARLVADNLTQSSHLRVASMTRVEALRQENPLAADLSREAAANGIGYLLTGEILTTPEGLAVAARLSDSAEGRQLAAERIDKLRPEGLLGVSDRIALSARKGLSVPFAEEVDVFSADSATRDPEAYQAYIQGLRELTLLRWDEAEKNFSAALEVQPGFAMAHYRLANVYAATGRMDQAQEELAKARETGEKLTPREVLYIRAAEAWYSRRHDEAIALYNELIQRYFYEPEARYYLALVYRETERPDKCIEHLTMLTRLEPQLHFAWNDLGICAIDLGDFEQAERALRRYAELEPGSANPHDSLADLYRRQGKFELSAKEYEQALAIDPNLADTQVKLGVVEAMLGFREKAERRLLAVYSDDRLPPRNRIDAAFELAYLRRAEGRFVEAAFIVEAVAPLLAAEKIREALGLSVRGISQMEIGKLEEARRLVDRAVEIYPLVSPRYLFARGLVELRSGQPGQARATAQQILRQPAPPNESDRTAEKAAKYLEGLADLKDGDFEPAIGHLSEAVNLQGYAYSVYRLGFAEAQLAAGNLQPALSEARKAAQISDYAEARLELELDRVRAILLGARILSSLGRNEEARAEAKKFLDRWPSPDPNLPEVSIAKSILGE